MAELTKSQIRTIAEAMSYPRGYGYVLDFSDKTFQEFFEDEFGIDIFTAEYEVDGSSKRNRLITFFGRSEKHIALRALRALWERREGLLDSLQNSDEAQAARAKSAEFLRVIDSLQSSAVPHSADGVDAFEGGFNRSVQHLRFCLSGRSVANEVPDTDVLHRNAEGDHVGPLEVGRIASADFPAV